MQRLTYLSAATAALGLAALTAGCTATGSGPQPVTTRSPAPAVSSAATNDGGGPSAPTPDPPGGPQPAQLGPVRTEPSTPIAQCDSSGVPVGGLLHAMRTGHHATFDRVVFEFCGSSVPEHHLRYADQVRQDPSDLPVPLRGQAFVRVVLHGGTTDTAPIAPDPKTAPRYTGPARLTPNHPLVKEVAIAGDFERVLSFGIGIDHPTGLHVQTLAAPPRLVVDFWSAAPRTLLWPASNRVKAQELQKAADEGHQPWFLPGSPQSMATFYAKQVLGWAQPGVRRISETVYEVSLPNTNESAVVTLVQPVRQGPGGVWVVADVAR